MIMCHAKYARTMGETHREEAFSLEGEVMNAHKSLNPRREISIHGKVDLKCCGNSEAGGE